MVVNVQTGRPLGQLPPLHFTEEISGDAERVSNYFSSQNKRVTKQD